MEELKLTSSLPRKTYILAKISLVLGIIGIIPLPVCIPSLLAIILGIIALEKIGSSNGILKGKKTAIAGITLGGFWFVLFPFMLIALSRLQIVKSICIIIWFFFATFVSGIPMDSDWLFFMSDARKVNFINAQIGHINIPKNARNVHFYQSGTNITGDNGLWVRFSADLSTLKMFIAEETGLEPTMTPSAYSSWHYHLDKPWWTPKKVLNPIYYESFRFITLDEKNLTLYYSKVSS